MTRNHFLLGLSTAALLRGQPATPINDEPVAAASGAFFALSVADMQASARWYQKRFDLTAVMQSPKADGAGVTVL
jgi:hypothetical protein